MPLKPVDNAIKVILGPCIDDTDFKTREEGLAHNQAGMEIDVILEKTDGTVTTTAVTPTAGGVHDWAHTDQGYYELEIPDAGGDYNNDTLGILRVVGYCTGVLPFSSVAYEIVPETVYASLAEGDDYLEVDTIQQQGVDLVAPYTGGYQQVNVALWAQKVAKSTADTDNPKVDIDSIKNNSQRAADLEEIAQYLFATAATLTSILNDDSVIGQLLTKAGVTNFDRTADSMEALGEKIAVDEYFDNILKPKHDNTGIHLVNL